MSLITLAELRTYLGVQDSADTPILQATVARASSLVEGVLGRGIASARVVETRYADSDGQFRVTRWPVSSVDAMATSQVDGLLVTGDATDVLSTVQVVESGVVLTRVTSAGTRTVTTVSTGETMAQLATAVSLISGFTATALVTVPWRMLMPTGIISTADGGAAVPVANVPIWPDHADIDYETGIVTVRRGWHGIDGDIDWNQCSSPIRISYTGGYATIPDDIRQSVLETAAQIYRTRRYDTGKTTGDFRTVATAPDLIEDIRAMLAHRLEVR